VAANRLSVPSAMVLELMDCGYAVIGPDGHFLETNTIFGHLFGYDANALRTMHMDMLWQDTQETVSWLNQVRAQKVLKHFPAMMKHRSGREMAVWVHARFIPGKHHVVCLFVLRDEASDTTDAPSAQVPIQLGELAKGLLQQYSREVFVREQRDFTYEIIPNLPCCMGHEGQLLKLFRSLLDNAIEATSPGDSITVYVRVQNLKHKHTGDDEPYVMLSVQDNGIGMDEETQQHIFEPNFSTKMEGRGMGLAGALQVIKAHQGRIHIKTGPRMGSLFKVYFPVCP